MDDDDDDEAARPLVIATLSGSAAGHRKIERRGRCALVIATLSGAAASLSTEFNSYALTRPKLCIMIPRRTIDEIGYLKYDQGR